MLVDGPAGVGKSRLVEHAVSELVEPGDVLMLGHCVDLYGEEMPYGGAADAVRGLIRRYGVEAVRSWSGRSAPALASLIPDLDPDVTEVAPSRLLEGFAALLENLSHERPTWLWIEDLHWSDRATRALVSWVMRTVAAPRLMVTCTLRTQEPSTPPAVTDFWTELRRLPHVRAVTLRPFTRHEVADHWRALSGSHPSAVLADRVGELSGGLPFYTELLAEAGWSVEQPLDESLRELASTPLTRLGPAGRAVVHAASVEDGRLSHAVLDAVLGGDVDVEAGIAQAVGAGVLTTEPGGDGYRFRHALIREAVADRLLPPERARWHSRWAARLEDSPTLAQDPFARIAAAHHWVGAGNASRAFDAALAAAELAGRIMALDEEARLLREVLELWPRVPDAEERCGYTRDDLLRSVVIVLAFLPDPPALRRLLDRELLTAGEDPVRDWVLREFRHRFFPADDEPAPPDVPDPDRAAADLVLTTPLEHPWLTRMAHELHWQFEREDPAMAARLAARGADSARLRVERTPPPRAYLPMTPTVDVVVADTGVQDVLYTTGDVEGAVRILEAMPRDLETRQIAGHEDYNLSDAQYVLGRYAEATATAQQGLSRIVEPHRAPGLWSGLMAQLAECQLALGRWDDAGTTLTRCGDLVVDDDLKSQALALAGLLACWRGRLDEAATLLARVQAAPKHMPELADLVRPRWLAAELAAARDDLDLVRSTLAPLWGDPGWEVASGHLWQPLLLQLRLEVDTLVQVAGPAADRARERVEACRAVAGWLHRVGDAGVAWDLHARAELGLADGCTDPGPWEETCAAWEKTGRVVEAAWARLRQAGCLAATRRRDEASAAVAGVRSLADDLGAVGLRAAADALATRIAGTGRRSGDAPYGLTGRELEVLRLVALGRSNAQIAEDLFISPKTVSVHVSSVLAKLQASSRTQAVATAQRTGLLEPFAQS